MADDRDPTLDGQSPLPPDSEPADGASAPEPRLVAREAMASLPNIEAVRRRRRGAEEYPPFGRADEDAAVLGPSPTEVIPGEGELLWDDLADDPLPPDSP